ncbi:MAG: hypothetical protein L3J41_06030 [Melioribacteraceae bacterium]|nr:hypothetical protein [Melioribacteraceae bacterium]
MSSNKFSINKPITISSISILLILVYIILFEFIWVTQNIIPKPSLIVDSFISLWSEYNLLDAFFETTAVILPAILIAVIILEALIKIFLRIFINYSGIVNIAAPFKYFSFFFVALILNFIFPESLLVELLFATFFLLFQLLKNVSHETNFLEEEYILAAKSLGLSKSQILSQIIWKSLKPKVYNNLVPLHTKLWGAVLIYEFIGASIGIGTIYRLAFNYNDLLAIISLGIFISIVILLFNSILKFVVSKLIFWK